MNKKYEHIRTNRKIRIVLAILGILLITGNAMAVTNASIDKNVSKNTKHIPNLYGGISSSADHPPFGTVIDHNLTKYYGTPTATGNGTTYWYVAGWWFNLTEMMNLPPRDIGASPYDCSATNSCGSGIGGIQGTQGTTQGTQGFKGDPPIPPTPEMGTYVLASVGIVGLFAFVKLRRKQ